MTEVPRLDVDVLQADIDDGSKESKNRMEGKDTDVGTN